MEMAAKEILPLIYFYLKRFTKPARGKILLLFEPFCVSVHPRTVECTGTRVDKKAKLSRMFFQRQIVRWCLISWKLKLIVVAYHFYALIRCSKFVHAHSKSNKRNCMPGPYLIQPELQRKYCLDLILREFQRFFYSSLSSKREVVSIG